jgi:hypothetical protein
MPISIRPFLSAFLLAAALPTIAQNRTVTHEPNDENVAEANVFMNAKLIAIQRDQDRIQVRDNNGVKKTLALAEDASIPESRIKAGTDVILAVREGRRGRQATVVSVMPSVPGSSLSGRMMNTEPIFIAPERPGDRRTAQDSASLRDVAAAQTSFQSGVITAPGGSGGTAAAGTQQLSSGTVLSNGTVVGNSAVLSDGTVIGGQTGTTNAGGIVSSPGTLSAGVSSPVVEGSAAGQLRAGAIAGTTVQTGSNVSPNSRGTEPGAQTLTSPVTGTTTQSAGTSPGNTAIIGDETGGQLRTDSVRGTTIQTAPPTGAPNTIGSPANTQLLTSPVTGTTTRSASQPGGFTTTGGTTTTSGSSVNTTTPAARVPESSLSNRTTTSTTVPPVTTGSAANTTAATAQSQLALTRSAAPPAARTSTGTAQTTTNGAGTVFTNSNLGGGQTAVVTQPTANGGTTTTVNRTGGGLSPGSTTTGSTTTAPATAVGGPVVGSPVVAGGIVGPAVASTAPNSGSTTTGTSTTIGSTQRPMPNESGGLGADASPLPIGHAVQAFEASIARLSQKADEVDTAFARYKEACVGLASPIGNLGTRSWFDIWDGSSIPAESRDECEPLLATAMRLGNAVQQGVQLAEDGARRSGVLPGVTRQIRAQYGLDWGGWDR